MYSAMRRQRSFRSTGSQRNSIRPVSPRASVNKSSTRRDSRMISSRLDVSARLYSSVDRSRRSVISMSPRITASGVRNSCEASEVNCFCRSKAACRREIMSLNVAARRPSSSIRAGSGTRSDKVSGGDMFGRARHAVNRAQRLVGQQQPSVTAHQQRQRDRNASRISVRRVVFWKLFRE